MPTTGHFIFIPLVLLIGASLGFILGLRAQADRIAMEAQREAQREKVKRERAERKAKREAARREKVSSPSASSSSSSKE